MYLNKPVIDLFRHFRIKRWGVESVESGHKKEYTSVPFHHEPYPRNSCQQTMRHSEQLQGVFICEIFIFGFKNLKWVYHFTNPFSEFSLQIFKLQ
jgi:hypothetical protein